MKDTTEINPLSAKSFETAAMRRMFSVRSAALNPRSQLLPSLTLSP